jgi:hypothetical protein
MCGLVHVSFLLTGTRFFVCAQIGLESGLMTIGCFLLLLEFCRKDHFLFLFFAVARNFRILCPIIKDAEAVGFGILLLHLPGVEHCNIKLQCQLL